jgi:glycosyltransferase involved in cell wall biosynthesis
MKILLVAPTYLPARRANTLQVMKMAQAMKVLAHEVLVLVPDSGLSGAVDWGTLAYHYGLHQKFDVKWLPVNPGLRSYDYGYQAVRHFRGWGADILYTRLPQAAALASTLGLPTIFEVHDLPGGFMGTWLWHRFLKGHGARRFVVITRSLKDAVTRKVARLPDSPFTVIAPDGVDLIRYEGIPEPLEARLSLQTGHLPGLSISQFTVGYTGHLYPGRGGRLILDIASHLPEITFLLVGGEPDEIRDLDHEVGSRHLHNVIITGFVSNTELPIFQAACDVLLMPYQRKVAASSGGDISHYLSPMKLFEYLACGRVILSSDLPVLREVLDDQNAILLPPDQVEAWVNAIVAIKDDPVRQKVLTVQARKDSQRYTWEGRVASIFNF